MKKRNQSLYDFFECLQLEYLVFELRRKIYPSSKDKSFCEKVMKYKRQKIDDIAQRNVLKSIFNDDEKRKEMRLKVYGDKGYPNFDCITYKSEAEREEFNKKDCEFYYTIKSDVRVEMEDGNFKVGILESVDHEKQVCEVKLRHSQTSLLVPIHHVTRIL